MLKRRKLLSAVSSADSGFFENQNQAAADSNAFGKIPSRLHAEDANAHLWAVSYSDVLMVMLCFFVIFFQGPEILARTQNAEVLQPGPEAIPLPQLPLTSLTQSLKKISSRVQVVTEKNAVIVSLPDDVFRTGSFRVDADTRFFLDEVIQVVGTKKDSVNIRVQGHSDVQPIINGSKRLVDSNMTLSTLRASRAVAYLVSKGIDPHHIQALGSAGNSRSTRSLSIEISERGVQQ